MAEKKYSTANNIGQSVAEGMMAFGDAMSGIYGQRGNTYGNYLESQAKRQTMEMDAIKMQQALDQQAIENQLKTSELGIKLRGLQTDERKLMMEQGYIPLTPRMAQQFGKPALDSPQINRPNNPMGNTAINQPYMAGKRALREFMAKTPQDAFGQRYKQPLTMQDKIAAANSQFGGNVPVGTTIYDKKTGTRVMLNRPLSEDEKASVSMVNYSTPRIKRMEQLIDSGTRDGNIIKDLIIEKNGQLLVGSKGKGNKALEELVGLANQIKVSGFALGGKNFTESEQKLIWGYLNPVGKSNTQYKKDINAANDILRGKASLTTGGMNEANRIMSSFDGNDVDLDGIFD